jgi:AcrR family transcriptional regulator
VIQALRCGQNFSDIARARGVTTGDVTRTFHRATAAQLVALFEGLTTDAAGPEALLNNPLAPITLTTPVDVMAVMLDVLARAQGIERFLDNPPPGVRLSPAYQLAQHFKVMELKLNWAEKFVDTRLKVLQLVNLDTWLQELLAMVEEVDHELSRALEAAGVDTAGVTLGLKGRLLERVREKLLGRPTSPTTPESFEGEVVP